MMRLPRRSFLTPRNDECRCVQYSAISILSKDMNQAIPSLRTRKRVKQSQNLSPEKPNEQHCNNKDSIPFIMCCKIFTRRCDTADLALRLARYANISSMQYKPVMRFVDQVFGNIFYQLLFCCQRRFSVQR